MTSAWDGFSGYTFAYSSLGRRISVDNSGAARPSGTPGVPDVKLSSTYDADGNRTSAFGHDRRHGRFRQQLFNTTP